MEGTYPLTLVRPGAADRDTRGQQVAGEGTKYPVWAQRRDMGGRERLADDTLVGGWTTRWTIRRLSLPRDVIPTEEWGLQIDGHDWDIVSVQESPGLIRQHWDIYATRRG